MVVSIGSVVRVPFGQRRVRGWVVGLDRTESIEDPPLKEIRQVSGDRPIFDEPLLQSLRWTAHRYVAPLSAVLPRSGPPNLPRAVAHRNLPPLEIAPARTSRLAQFGRVAASRGRPRTTYVLAASSSTWSELIIETLHPVLAAERSAMVVGPTAVEVADLAGRLRGVFGRRVVEVSPALNDGPITTRWSLGEHQPGLVVIGTERIALWPVAELATAIIVDEGRRGMKARQTPTVHVREVLRSRSAIEHFGLIMMGRVPTTEAIASGPEVIQVDRRLWPLVEVVDRTEEPPGAGVVTDRARIAIRGVVARGGEVFVFTHRRGYAPAFRCIGCRSLRVCATCGSKPSASTVCSRCGADLGPCGACGRRSFEPLGAGVGRVVDELRRATGAAVVGEVGDERQVTVGTERDIAGFRQVDLAVAVDADGLILGTNYRSQEEALRTLARVASLVGGGSGRRLVLQTAQPNHPIIAALRRGDPMEALTHEIAERASLDYPPVGELLVLEVRNGPAWVEERLRQAVRESGSLLGPVDTPRGLRWLLQSSDLSGARRALRGFVQEVRDAGGSVRVDVDPLDL